MKAAADSGEYPRGRMTNDQAPMTNGIHLFIGHWGLVIGISSASLAPRRQLYTAGDDGRRMISPPIDWDAALAQHGRWLRTIVLARVRERQAVDEVMQEVALAAVRQSAPLLDVAKVAPWLYRLAVRHSLLHRRKCGRKRK